MTSSAQKTHAVVKEDMQLSAKVNLRIKEQEKTKGYQHCGESTRISAFKAEFEKLRDENQAYAEKSDNLSGRFYRHSETSTLFPLLQASSLLMKIDKEFGKEKGVSKALLKQQQHQ